MAYYSKQLTGVESHYSATELEALAIVRAVKHFAHWLWGKRFMVVMDHSPLKHLLFSNTLLRRIQNWALQLQDFDFEIKYRPGKENVEPDAVSRQEWGNYRWNPDEFHLRLGGCGDPPHVGDQPEEEEVGDKEDNKVDASLYIASPQ